MLGFGRSAATALRAALCCALCTEILIGGSARARAQPPIAAAAGSGTILQLDGTDVLIDLSSAQLAGAAQLTVYRAIEVRHPITGKHLRDRFVIGSLRVLQTGQTLSIARAVDPPEHPFAVGDQVELAAPAAAAQSGEPARAEDSGKTAPSAAPDAAVTTDQAALGAAWFETLGKPPAARAQIYTGFLRRYPGTAYRETLDNELSVLRALADAEREAQQARSARARRPALPMLELAPVSDARVGEAIELAGLVRTKVPLRSIVLYARPLSSTDYQRFALQFAGGNHVRVRLPAALSHRPGFAYFVEGVDALGRVVTLADKPEAPRLVPVAEPDATEADEELRTRVRFSSELVSFDGTSGRDYFLVSEGDFFYRLALGPLVGLRVGYGNYTGRGGTVEQLDRRGLPPRAAGFTYGFVESELGLHRLFGVAARVTVGLGRPDLEEQTRSELTGGVQLRTRFGAADGTHLVLAGEVMPEIGQRAYLGLHFEAIRSLPMAAEVVVTDQPVHSKELAVRLVYELGYRLSARFALALRTSYQLRTIAHAGPGVGLAASFDF